MTTPTIPQTVLFPDLFDRPLVATFDQPHASSDGGAVLLKAAMLLAESHLTNRLFGAMLRRIWALPVPAG